MTTFEILSVGGAAVLCLALAAFLPHLVRSLFRFQALDLLWIILLVVGLFGVTYFSPVDYSEFDALGNLLTSQSLLQQGTTHLEEHIPPFTGIMGWHLREKHGHRYYHYPLGTPIYAIPLVWLANTSGFDMAQRSHDSHVQNLLSALSVVLAGIFVYLICRQYTSENISLLLTSVFTFGSSIASTMGTALWSINGATLFILLSMLTMLSMHEGSAPDMASPYFLGLFLFSAYLCRPTAAIFVMLVFIYLLLKKRALFWNVILTWLILFGGFILFSLREYRQLLPDYYLPGQLGNSQEFWTALYGNLFSPARGLLVYSPYLFLTIVGVVYGFKALHNKLLAGLSLAWIFLHLILISKNEMWWGGGCYGNRMFADVLPASLLLTLEGWQVFGQKSRRLQRRIIVSVFMLFGGLAIFINTYQGLYNTSTIDWGSERRHIFDWQYPQFLASHENLGEREIRDQTDTLEPYRLSEPMSPGSNNAIFANWYWIEGASPHTFRWSRGPSSSILFRLPLSANEKYGSFSLEMQLGAFDKQVVTVRLNGENLGDIVISSGDASTTHTLPVQASLLILSPDAPYQTLEFLIPGAIDPNHMFGKGWIRALGIRLYQIRLHTIPARESG